MEHCPEESVFSPLGQEGFNFRCHKDIACFNKCCSKLRLILTPYDVLRLKNRLGISSEKFLEKYTETVVDGQNRFPNVRLKMINNEKQSCPFVTPEGCAVYEDRPGACRLYPLGRASTAAGGTARETFFVVKESHCLGFNENKTWQLEEWIAHEGVDEYNLMNDEWLKILTSSKRLGTEQLTRKLQVFFMVSYNLDRFRKFLFESSFFSLFEVSSGLKHQLARDDTALMQFGFKWLRFSLFGEKTIKTKALKHSGLS